MNTIALPRRRLATSAAITTQQPFNTYAIASAACLMIFASYLLAFRHALAAQPVWTLLCLIIAPALALVFSVKSLHSFVKYKSEARGMVLAYISFIVSAFYFIAALALPFVLLGFYIVYVYIW
jgi:hypothetical protein